MKRFVMVALLFVASNACAEIYTWKDARGTVFYTNSLNEIPARYLSRAKLLDVATGKKSPIAAGAPGQAGTNPAPGQQPQPQSAAPQQIPPQQAPAPNPAQANSAPAAQAVQPPDAAKAQPRGSLSQRRRPQQNRAQSPVE